MSNDNPTEESVNLDSYEPTQGPKHGFFERLYTGTGGFPIVSRRKFFYTLSAVRSYTAGESAWSKGYKHAIHALEHYVISGDVDDFRRVLVSEGRK